MAVLWNERAKDRDQLCRTDILECDRLRNEVVAFRARWSPGELAGVRVRNDLDDTTGIERREP